MALIFGPLVLVAGVALLALGVGGTCWVWALVAAQLPARITGAPPCANCGYDLRGTKAAGRGACPECGAEVG